jgi:hypothetical protein
VPDWSVTVSDETETFEVRRPLTVDELEHWRSFGATWRLVEMSDEHAIVDLCQCTGELVEQRGSSDPLVMAYLHTHSAADP